MLCFLSVLLMLFYSACSLSHGLTINFLLSLLLFCSKTGGSKVSVLLGAYSVKCLVFYFDPYVQALTFSIKHLVALAKNN